MATDRSYSEWVEILNRDGLSSCGLSKKVLKKKVSIPPSYMNKLRMACEHILTADLNKYNDDLHGAIVSFDKNSIRPTSSTTSLANSPADAFLHFTIKVDIILFAPKAGIYLSGECTEVNFYF